MDVNRDFAPGLQPPQAVTRNVLIELHHPILIKDKSLTYMENFDFFKHSFSQQLLHSGSDCASNPEHWRQLIVIVSYSKPQHCVEFNLCLHFKES